MANKLYASDLESKCVMMKKSERFKHFIEVLKKAPSVDSQQAAWELLKKTMDSVENTYSGLPQTDYGDRMHVYPIKPEFGWRNIEGDPCIGIDAFSKKHETQLFQNGRIVISNIESDLPEVLLDKSGT